MYEVADWKLYFSQQKSLESFFLCSRPVFLGRISEKFDEKRLHTFLQDNSVVCERIELGSTEKQKG